MDEFLRSLGGFKSIVLQPAFIIWLVIDFVGSLAFRFNPDNESKKKYFPLQAIFSGVMFIAFTIIIHFPLALIILLAVPITSAITYFNVRTGRICASCGRYNQKLRPESIRCRECGMEITD